MLPNYHTAGMGRAACPNPFPLCFLSNDLRREIRSCREFAPTHSRRYLFFLKSRIPLAIFRVFRFLFILHILFTYRINHVSLRRVANSNSCVSRVNKKKTAKRVSMRINVACRCGETFRSRKKYIEAQILFRVVAVARRAFRLFVETRWRRLFGTGDAATNLSFIRVIKPELEGEIGRAYHSQRRGFISIRAICH